MPNAFDSLPPDDSDGRFDDGAHGEGDGEGYGDRAWDEHQWEAFLRESDRRIHRYLDLLFHFAGEHPAPDAADGDAYRLWRARVQRYLTDNCWPQDDYDFAFLFLEGHSDAPEDEVGLTTGFDDDLSDALDFRDLPLYRQAHTLSHDVLAWADGLPSDVKDSALVQFCACLSQAAANVAKGHGIGTEHDGLGGNIACAKRALREANLALGLLQELRAHPYLGDADYRPLYERVYELRNALGIHVQDLRARFDLGID